MESDSVTKRNERYVVTWMNLKNILKTSKNSDTKVYIQYLFSQLCLSLWDPMQYDSLYIINF